MYNDPKFIVEDKATLISFINEFPLGTIVIPVDEDYPEVSAIPFLVYVEDNTIVLRSHVMKHASHYRALLQQKKVTVLFHGPQSYVSASWYKHPTQASTWNYSLVQAQGTVNLTGEVGLIENIKTLTNRFEQSDSPAAFDLIPRDYIDKMLPHIAGIEIRVSNLNGVFKLSQNKDDETRMQIIEQLERRSEGMDLALAELMRNMK